MVEFLATIEDRLVPLLTLDELRALAAPLEELNGLLAPLTALANLDERLARITVDLHDDRRHMESMRRAMDRLDAALAPGGPYATLLDDEHWHGPLDELAEPIARRAAVLVTETMIGRLEDLFSGQVAALSALVERAERAELAQRAEPSPAPQDEPPSAPDAERVEPSAGARGQ